MFGILKVIPIQNYKLHSKMDITHKICIVDLEERNQTCKFLQLPFLDTQNAFQYFINKQFCKINITKNCKDC